MLDANNITIEYRNAYVEVLEVLKNMSQEDVNKIPKDIIKTLETYKSREYVFIYNIDKEFKNQKLSKKAKCILANFYRDYWAPADEKNEIIKRQRIIRANIEEEKRKKYDPDVFKGKQKLIETEEIKDLSREVNVIEKKENILYKLINSIKGLFRKL